MKIILYRRDKALPCLYTSGGKHLPKSGIGSMWDLIIHAIALIALVTSLVNAAK